MTIFYYDKIKGLIQNIFSNVRPKKTIKKSLISGQQCFNMGSDPGADLPQNQDSLLKEILEQQKITNDLLREILDAITNKDAE